MLSLRLLRNIFIGLFAMLLCVSVGDAYNKAIIVKVVDGDTLRIEINKTFAR